MFDNISKTYLKNDNTQQRSTFIPYNEVYSLEYKVIRVQKNYNKNEK